MDINDIIEEEIKLLKDNVGTSYEFRNEVKSLINSEKIYRKFKVEKYNNFGINKNVLLF